MAKFNLKKQSKRQPARQRYKIEKRVRDHNKKLRREAKKNPKSKKPKQIQVPNICPFKEDILKEVEALKKQKEEEKQKLRDQARLERQRLKQEKAKATADGGLESLVSTAEARGKLHSTFTPAAEQVSELNKNQENSLKAYYKEFKKVVEAADVVLEILDSRDPLGTRCLQVEQAVSEAAGNKRLVIVLNKADLVPRDILDKWLKYFRKSLPAVVFKASTQNQSRNLAQRKLHQIKKEKAMQTSTSVGAELLMSILANYCRNKGIKTSIRVGVVGLPNVGKSSLINSLKRSRACNVGATPGLTRVMQEVQLDSKIKLLDSPGIVFATGNDSSASLRNAVKVTSLADPVTPANAILQRVSKQQMMEMYDIKDYSTPEEFYSFKAARMGRFKKGGVPDSITAARSLIEDWNNGKIKYYTIPPEENKDEVHISAQIVTEVAKEFNLEEFESMETDILGQLEKENVTTAIEVDTFGSVAAMEDDKVVDNLLSDKLDIKATKVQKKGKIEPRTKKLEPEMQLEGNLKLNQVKKMQFKKQKKEQNRREKVALQLSQSMENVSVQNGEQYDFDADYDMT